jgi:hypothetical protein
MLSISTVAINETVKVHKGFSYVEAERVTNVKGYESKYYECNATGFKTEEEVIAFINDISAYIPFNG